ncbi:hypothetical protein MMC26_005459 [Xylographa opegraphella]|nr:hypothetical protein [Xylographa opegraphella]
MSPRRSSRARTIQPPAPGPVHTNSSTSSVSSGRAERSTRSHHKLPSPNTSNPPRSLSLEDPDEAAKPQLRRTRSGHEETKETLTQKKEDEDEDEVDEEDVTRCVCGQLDYPGLPTSTVDALKQASKDAGDVATSAPVPEDIGGLFIQCDICKVWQHGGCVGVMDAGMREAYFCEQCRKDLHKLMTGDNGQKYSRYLPVQDERSPQATPEPSPKDGSLKKGRERRAPRASAEALAHKRRSTMNSRDAAYDEAEQLRMAIEESKREGGAPSMGDGSRRNKRSRSESADQRDPSKRQRTNSHSSSSPSTDKANPIPASSSDEALAALKDSEHSPKKIRGAAARNHREKEQREQRERERADAAGRRAARSERRRDSDPSDEPQPRVTSARLPDSANNAPPSPDTPPAIQDLPPRGSSHKKTGRPAAKRGRVGRNQYTKDRDLPTHAHAWNGSQLDVNGTDTPLTRGRSRSRSNANDTTASVANGINGHGHGAGSGHWGEAGKPSKPKHMNPNRTSLNEMKRRVAGIMEFVSRTQTELEGRDLHTPPESGGSAGSQKNDNTNGAIADARDPDISPSADAVVGKALVQGVINGLSALAVPQEPVTEKQFASLSSAQMMAVLKGRLVGWQKEFGVWGEK